MHILVTGGAGFIASHVATRFMALDHDVTILDDLSSGFRENLPPSMRFVQGDITDQSLVGRLFGQRPFDVVCHHAAQMSVVRSVAEPVFDAQVNVLGTLNLLQQCVQTGVKRFMFSSTGGALYGEQETFPAAEDHPTRPVSPYGISKLTCEHYINYYHAQHGLLPIIMRYANVYGPRQNPHGEAGVVAIFSRRLAAGGQVTINGDGLQTRDYIHVDDVVAANVAALNHDGPITFNIGTGIETDVVTLYGHLLKAANRDSTPHHGPAMPGEQRRSVISPAYALETMGWAPQVSLADGLAMTYRSFT
ncbi:MAG: NAD-dependent epimerase/dehydratase family protein [Candidatus Marinimicrobia bacterium]|nr:NAD-dependent epimerase/dehydratase family protein [Candidatus Neomarinimicrobiota bacterium]